MKRFQMVPNLALQYKRKN